MYRCETIHRLLLSLALVCALNVVDWRQQIYTADPDFVPTVSGDVEHELKLRLQEISHLPRHSIRTKDESGKERLFEGVLRGGILKSARVKFGEGLRGKITLGRST